jgi:PTH1 family peptidyl-tRNA hydrolase
VLLVLGLGNPGERYARTRHNVAWQVLDELAARHHAGRPEQGPTGREWQVAIAGRDVRLLQPLTFMNLSGQALADWRDRYGMEEELLVVTDDVYLPLGTLRVRASGSTGGHRGLESIEAAVGHRDYTRLRIGVGAAENSEALREHVLEEFAPEELPALEAAIRRAADGVECWVAEGALGTMNRFNRRVDPSTERVRQEDSET